ncbi:MAG: DUF1330 domain-containing protein [Anaerolineae bacterium]|nr:DUF1330 domain-containing protein [Anaerolineae bacterium]
MAAYVIVQVRVHNPAPYEEYKKGVLATVEKFGGRFLVRGGKVETVEGAWKPERFVILEFPSMERARAWWNSPEYQTLANIRFANASSEMIFVEGVG